MILLVLPSRGRPLRAAEAVAAAQRLAVLPDTRIFLVIDRDDPWLDGYLKGTTAEVWPLRANQTGNLVKATNSASMALAEMYPDAIIGNIGDDHIIRTEGWDRLVTDALAEPGIAYGDDLIWGQKLATAPFISASIVRALGWYALPSCRHMWIDYAWMALGEHLERLHYIPELVIEHVHPGVGKAKRDEGYDRADRSMKRDRQALDRWFADGMTADVERVRLALA